MSKNLSELEKFEGENGKNIFFSYSIQEDNGGYYVIMSDLDRNSHEICFTKNEKVAEYLVNNFDSLAIAEERDLFEGLN